MNVNLFISDRWSLELLEDVDYVAFYALDHSCKSFM